MQYTLGNRRIQHYLTTLPDGRIIVLPPSWDILRQEWFHNLEIAAPDQKEQAGSVPVQVWNKNCFGCHVSEEIKNYDVDAREYRTEWLDFGGHCERCHGPGEAHAELYEYETEPFVPEKFIVMPTDLDQHRSSQICAQCHSFRDVLKFGYTAGDDYFDYFFPLLEYTQEPSSDPTWYPDGKTRRFLDERARHLAERVLRPGRRHVHDVPRRHPRPRDRAERTAHSGAPRAVHRLPREHRKRHRGPHVPPGGERGQLLRRVSHAAHRLLAQGADAGPQHQRAVPREHDPLRHPERLQPVSRGPVPGVVRGGARPVVSRQPAAREDEPCAPRRSRAPAAVSRAPPRSSSRSIPIRSRVRCRAPTLSDTSAASTTPRVFPMLVGALNDEHPMVRSIAALKLGEQTNPQTVGGARQALVTAIQDPTRVVRMNAAISLLNLGVQKLQGRPGELLEEAKADHAARGAFHADDAPQQLNLGQFHVLAGQNDAARGHLREQLPAEPEPARDQVLHGGVPA